MEPTSAAGVALIITDVDHKRFFMQRKNDLHPVPSCRGCLSFWGGSLEGQEGRREGLIRELREEIADLEIQELLIAKMRPWRTFLLPVRQFGQGNYVCSFFVVELAADECYFVQHKIEGHKKIICEGIFAPFTADELLALQPDDFVASHEIVFARFIALNSRKQ